MPGRLLPFRRKGYDPAMKSSQDKTAADETGPLGALRKAIDATAGFIWYVAKRFWNDRCFASASSLSYTMLLAVVPLLAIAFAIMSAFPVFKTIQADLQAFMLKNFLPENVEQVQQWFEGFLQNTRELTALGTVALAVTAIILLDTIETKFNDIWRQHEVRPLYQRITMYWAIITMTPLLLGGSVAASTIVISGAGLGGENSIIEFLVKQLGYFLFFAAMTVAYIIIPYRRVLVWHAMVGAVVATLFFEGLKAGFALYFTLFPSYQTLYGALSLIPLFLVWMYLVWCMVLLGAQFAAAFPEWFARRALGGADTGGRRMVTALAVLNRLYEGGQVGAIATEAELAQMDAVDPQRLPGILDELLQLRLIVRAEEEGWLLARDPASVRLYELMPVFGLQLVPVSGLPAEGPGWAMIAAAALKRADGSARETLDMTLSELFAPDKPVQRNLPNPPLIAPAAGGGASREDPDDKKAAR